MAFDAVDYKSLSVPAAPFSDPTIIPDFPKNKVPRHVGVIMDGNGRWAQQRGLIRTDGHQAAEPVVFDTIAGAIEAGVRYLSLYTFSTENWKRSRRGALPPWGSRVTSSTAAWRRWTNGAFVYAGRGAGRSCGNPSSTSSMWPWSAPSATR